MPDPDSPLVGLVRRLRDADPQHRSDALEELRGLAKKLILPSDGRFLLKSASNPYPAGEAGTASTSAELIRVAAAAADPSFIPVVKEIHPALQADARSEALSLLAAIDDEAGAIALLELLESAAASGSPPQLDFVQLQRMPKFAEVYFPRMLQSARGDAAFGVFSLCLAWAAEGSLSRRALAKHAGVVVDAYRSLREKPGAGRQTPAPPSAWDDDTAASREDAGLLLDLMGYFPLAEVEASLRQATTSRDPKLALFATMSLLRLGRAVASEVLDRVAAAAETRSMLFDGLHRLGKEALFPREWATQEALATSEMVNWLAYPTELECPPDEIELMKVVREDSSRGTMEWYVFRYRTHPPHWASSRGWMAGVAGPFRTADAPSTTTYGDTFSTMAAWESMTPDQHLTALRELMAEWRRRRDSP